jgi:hypothetical protein
VGARRLVRELPEPDDVWLILTIAVLLTIAGIWLDHLAHH